MRYGYARTSTTDQKAGLADQVAKLKAAGAERVLQEEASAGAMGETARPVLDALLKIAGPGDALIVTKIDRLARNVVDLLELATGLRDRGVDLVILDIAVDTSSPTGWLILTILGAVAEMERGVIKERQAIGIAAAKADGRYKGRKPTVAARVAEMQALKADGFGAGDIARKLGVARSSVYRVLGAE